MLTTWMPKFSQFWPTLFLPIGMWKLSLSGWDGVLFTWYFCGQIWGLQCFKGYRQKACTLLKWRFKSCFDFQGISRVHIYFNPKRNSYRIMGKKLLDNQVVVNCVIGRNLKYNKATATFHQWKEQRQVISIPTLPTPTGKGTIDFESRFLHAVNDKISNFGFYQSNGRILPGYSQTTS